jgi:uncharacterized protein
MRLRLIALVALSLASSALAQSSTPAWQELTDYIKDNYTKREVMIPMRDGVKLFAAVYEPKDKSRTYPILIQRTPYDSAPYGEGKFPPWLGPTMLYAREKYVFVFEDVRGRWMSEGEFVDVRPETAASSGGIDESTDTYDTVDWLVKNIQNNNGRVGLYGVSYPGYYTSAGIINSHPAIKAASPQAPVGDWFIGDDWHHNGAFFLASTFYFYTIYGQPRPAPITPENDKNKKFDYGTRDGYKFFLDLGPLSNAAERARAQLGAVPPFWAAMAAHPNYDAFWEARTVLPRLRNIHCAVMTVGGWFDAEDLFGALRTYEAIERQNPGIYNVLVMGPWRHGEWQASYSRSLGNVDFESNASDRYRAEIELPFFNYFLKDEGDLRGIHEINAFDTGAKRWTMYDATRNGSWSPANAAPRTIYLQPGGKLDFVPPAATASAYDEYVSDPAHPVPYTDDITIGVSPSYMTGDQRPASRRPDVLTYQTDPLNADISIAGDFRTTLFASTSGTDSDFVVKIIDVLPDSLPANPDTKVVMGGYQMLVRGEPFRARFRNSFAKPEPMRPNMPEKIEFVMPGITHTFRKGHRIMVQIQSTWFPLVDRNPQRFVPNIFEAKESDFQKATQRIYHAGAQASQITLQVVP